MTLRHAVIGAALFVGVSAGSAFAGGLYSTTMPSVPSSQALTGNELSPADTGLANGAQPQTEVISTQQYRAKAYSQQTPTTGFSITVPNGTSLLLLTPAGTLATGTITLPSAPVDGQEVCIFDTQTQTALTLSPNTGQTINGTAISALTANTKYCYVYAASTANAGTANAWYRSN